MDREQIINDYSRDEFYRFLKNDTTGKVLELFNNKGIDILRKNDLRSDRIRYVLCFSPYKNELLQNPLFLDLVLNKNISDYYHLLEDLNKETYNIILDRYINMQVDIDEIAILFSHFNLSSKLEMISNWPYQKEILSAILNVDDISVINKIINQYNIDLTDGIVDIYNFFKMAKQSVLKASAARNLGNKKIEVINIPSRMITKDLAKLLWDKYDIFMLRNVINIAEYSIDTTDLSAYIKNKEDNIINNSSDDLLVQPFANLWDVFKKYKEAEKSGNYDLFYNYRREYTKIIRSLNNEEIYNNIELLYKESGLEDVYNYISKLSNNIISNYVIDYHFEENYHNIMIDIRELLNYYYDGNIYIPKERIEIYESIANIDNLTITKKQQLHEYLKNINLMQIFYDDMAYARHLVAEAIKEYSLNAETIKQYRDEKLSKKYGVDVYNMNDNYFFGIVKTGRHQKDKLPAGHSYSLIGNSSLAVFGDAKDSDTFLYDAGGMNPEQLVHVYPYDSYTLYHPFEYSEDATRRVNVLLTPEQLVNESTFSYNELLILEKGSIKTDIDESITELQRIALYCLNEITEQDVEVAKKNNVGIILINTNKYQEVSNRHSDIYGPLGFDYNYFDGQTNKDKFENKR